MAGRFSTTNALPVHASGVQLEILDEELKETAAPLSEACLQKLSNLRFILKLLKQFPCDGVMPTGSTNWHPCKHIIACR